MPTTTASRRPSRCPSTGALATGGLLAVTAAWGSTFFLFKDVVTRVPVADFLAVRFALAAVVLTLLFPRALGRLSRAEVRQGAALGLVYGLAQVLQTTGLQHTSASVSGFITGMYVVLTPVLGLLLLRTRVSPHVWVAVALATTGLGVLSLQGLAVGTGELVTLASALLYAAHIVGLGLWSTSRSALGLTVLQLWVITAVCGVAAAPGGLQAPDRGADWAVLVYAALVAGALALVVQTWAQAHLPATRVAVVMTMEPVWAAGFAVALGGEAFGTRLLLGGALVLTAMYVAELAPGPRGRRALLPAGHEGLGVLPPGHDLVGSAHESRPGHPVARVGRRRSRSDRPESPRPVGGERAAAAPGRVGRRRHRDGAGHGPA